ncbi:uncharacterized protein LOC126901025 [Daktulosphaira vitifoliae]|uniref:uncharacterized protein LOC126901025 n=1 Tax=Daktulosphaira vitifoliae TaxID=58002 RepID=UPI0021AAECEF|nr:uncharacterized protein LOC126901025 [Daktulosphaira vitifoliae]
MFIFILIAIFFLTPLSTKSNTLTDTEERHCNFSRYMLNYFKYNERYLLYLEANIDKISDEDLIKYGEALQTHCDVILFMIEDLVMLNIKFFPTDLMAINLYLNNVFGSVNVISANNKISDKKYLRIQGYKILHYNLLNYLNQHLNNYCLAVKFASFTKYFTDMDVPDQLNVQQLISALENPKKKIIMEINPEVIKNKNNLVFIPKILIFYDLLTYQPIDDEKHIMNKSQARQYQQFINGEPKDYLDLLRFTPLNRKCSDGTDLTISDVFRYIKYQFSYHDMRAFQKLVILATFHPVGVLIGNYIKFSIDVIHNYYNTHDYKITILPSIKTLGQDVSKILSSYKKLNLFNDLANNFLSRILDMLNNFLQRCVVNLPMHNKNLLNSMIASLQIFLENNFLKFEIKSAKFIKKKNFSEKYESILHRKNQVELYLIELEKKMYYIPEINLKHQRKMNLTKFKYFLDDATVEHLCKNDAYNFIDKINENLKNTEISEDKNNKLNSSSSNNIGKVWKTPSSVDNKKYERCKDANLRNEDINSNNRIKLIAESKYFPKYMVDYLLFAE